MGNHFVLNIDFLSILIIDHSLLLCNYLVLLLSLSLFFSLAFFKNLLKISLFFFSALEIKAFVIFIISLVEGLSKPNKSNKSSVLQLSIFVSIFSILYLSYTLYIFLKN